jgi:hypothetical protein
VPGQNVVAVAWVKNGSEPVFTMVEMSNLTETTFRRAEIEKTS